MSRLKFLSAGLAASLVVFSGAPAAGFARSEIPDIYDDYEGVDLALKLVLDGRTKLGEKVLKSTEAGSGDLNKKSQSNRHRVMGLLAEESATGKSDLDLAALHFSKAIGFVESVEVRFDAQRVDLARKSYASCVDNVRKVKLSMATVVQLRTAMKCYRGRALEIENPRDKSEILVEAHLILRGVMAAQPALSGNPSVQSEHVELLMDLGLQEAAQDLAVTTMKAMARNGVKGVSTLALDLSERPQATKYERRFQAHVLEAARYFVPHEEQEEILAANAKLAYSEGKSLTSALAFEQLASFSVESKSQVQSAVVELFRLSGWRSRAGELISHIEDPKERLRARVTGFFERNETGKVAAMFPSLDRHFLGDDEWIYLGAFARLQSGGWLEEGPEAPVKWLAKLKGAESRSKSATLRQFVDTCRTRPDLPCEL